MEPSSIPPVMQENTNRVLTVIIIIGLIVLIVRTYRWYVGKRETIVDDMIPASKPVKMASSKYIVNSPEEGMGFSTSIWIHIRDWNYKYGQEKVVCQKGNLKMYIDGRSNDLKIDVPVFPRNKQEKMYIDTLVYPNIPLQKWIHVIVILDNRSLDLWMNGKLYLSKYLTNIPKIDNKAPFLLFPDGGFDGWAGRIVHYRYPITKKMIQRGTYRLRLTKT